ncbi:uncharacterized protein LOC109802233 isoform X2 [Cajanus cajan]|nr:uncharacterized protein LOC109802233 isoform X2 [Cajanus cajan]XP_020219100.1 uncharacterized protein LOC109802233 isoform X2 [Cajanus cajan]XP_020219101.1 uncharacterized protein LOC109802233 isoform X2 [Cajanus cajan]XP_020219102.1 uncharacterized protein LOC109802233 isoform X2 [Cajanus cajan]XP_029128110.1 uncharacterized protein LOC109802233 isoform X2 [Cajanus cajan]
MGKEHGKNPIVMSEGESETFSDIDDDDVDVYLHDEEGKNIKKILWEKVNRVYLLEQAAKEATGTKAVGENLGNCSEVLLAARDLDKAVAKSRKERKQREGHESKNLWPAQSATEAVGQSRKSRVNFDRLNELLN